MVTYDEICFLLGQVQYKDGWRFFLGSEPSGDLYLQVRFHERCAETGEMAEQRGRKWRLSYHMTRSEVVQTAFLAALTAEEHECRERFLYRGVPIFGPHFDVDKLHDLASGLAIAPAGFGGNNDLRLPAVQQ